MSDIVITVNKELTELITRLNTSEDNLEQGYVRLGQLLSLVNIHQHWKELGYKSFGAYMNEVSRVSGIGRSQLYQYFSTVRQLNDCLSSDDLITLGIAKASKLARHIKKTGFGLTKETIKLALDKNITVADLSKILFEDNLIDKPKGTWFNQEGFYVNEDERLVIREADELALRIDPVVPIETPDWIKRKESRLRQCMEFLSTHGGK